MSEQIPDEAVEAAVAAVPSDAFYHIDRDDLRNILEAAAPHMLREAWEAGHEGGKSDAFAADKGFTGYHANPYRPAK